MYQFQLEKSLGVTNGDGLALDKDRNSGKKNKTIPPSLIFPVLYCIHTMKYMSHMVISIFLHR